MPLSDLGTHTPRIDSGYPSPRTTRSPSISSDIPSVATHGGLLSPPISVSPDPAFIAVSAASQIVTNDHDSQSEAWLDQHGIEPSGETALVSPPALKLVNRFLDQLLFNFLSTSRSTTLAALRPAVSEVLKPKLAKGAIRGADEELHEYLGGEDDEELLALHQGPTLSRDWDLELVWKRTRLRCMVYSSLGDMEEEDEDYYTEQGSLNHSRNSSQNPDVVSPAVAIFLTSILEFMGEQILVVAGQAAYHRLRMKHERDERDGLSTPAEIAERVIVEEADMERVALDRTLGRLWRGWKKRIRSPSLTVTARPFSRESIRSQPRPDLTTEGDAQEDPERSQNLAGLTEDEHAAQIPLPLAADDVREIEIPGLAQQSDVEDETEDEAEELHLPTRPKSFHFWPQLTHDLHAPAPSHTHIPKFLTAGSRKRSYSLPSTASKQLRPSKSESSESNEGVSENQEDTSGDEPAETIDEVSAVTANNMDEEEAQPELPPRSAARMAVVGTAAGATAIEAVAAAKREPIETESEPEDGETEEDFNEEAQIMTSSRISIGGRISPDDLNIPSKRSSVRSHSVHSIRVVEVSTPRSPARSRGTSIDATDYSSTARSVIVSRPSSMHSSTLVTPIVRSASQGRTASPISRNASSNSSRHVGTSAQSISEGEEHEASENDLGPEPVLPSHFAAAMQGVDVWSGAPSPQFNSPAASKDTKPRTSPFVLSPAPATRNARGNTSAPMNEQVANQANGALSVGSKTRGDHGGVPPLTPLREMMEGAQDTSDEASSVAMSHDGQSFYENGLNGHSPSVSASSLVQRSVRTQPPSVTRASPPRSSREESARKESKTQRPIHTSGSGSSSVSHKFKALRSSEESVPVAVEAKGRSFEQLIRSDQTIQYTLTPANMRDIDAPDSPHSPRLVASPMRSNFPNLTDPPRPASNRSNSSSKYGKPGGVELSQPFKNSKAPTARVPVSPGLRSNAQPRDARIEAESIEDFAEFIKTSGPPKKYDPPRSMSVADVPRPPRKSSIPEPSTAASSTLPTRSDSSAGRMRLQARDAVVSRSDGISDLIEFMRSGPQVDMDSHRTPRMTDSAASNRNISQTPTSVHSSVTSQSNLLNGASKMNKALPVQNNREYDEEDMMPKRKQRRVRDMYQIDFSDEEEEYESTPRPQPIKEESLADFLRNVPPPPESMTSPIFDTAPPPDKKVKRKSSTTGIMSRFGRNSSQVPAKLSGQDVRPGSQTSSAAGHTPITVQFSNTYRPTTSENARGGNYASQPTPPRTKVVQKSYQPREAVYSTSRTNELAAFLRDSDPPTAMHAQPQTFIPTVQKDEASTFQRVFGRRKAH